MRTDRPRSRLLGFALLFQAVTSILSGAVLLGPLVVAGDIDATMARFAAHALQARAAILGDALTALGIVLLAAVFYRTLRARGETASLVALGLYLVEATLLMVSRVSAYALLQVSQTLGAVGAVGAGEPLRAMAVAAHASMEFAYTLHMLPFCLGAILFYALLDKGRLIPRILSLWGVVTVPIALVATVLALLGVEVPFAVYLPYAPWEFVVGIYLLIVGIPLAEEGA